jgi:thiamine-phosphate diphosphorylase
LATDSGELPPAAGETIPASDPAAGPPPPAGGPRSTLIPVVHAITEDRILARSDFLEQAAAIMRALGPRGAVHLRARSIPAARLYALALALREAEARSGAWLVVNDRLDLALAAGAHAVQLTSRSITVRDARRIALPSGATLELGASVHTPEEAAAAAAAGASWVVAGHVFATPTHPTESARGPELVRRIARAAGIPCIAIGGIRPEHVAPLRDAGAHGVAAIRGIWDARDAERAAIDYLSPYEHPSGSG